MNSVDYVKKVCSDRGLPISKLERDLGFSNAYISGLKKGKFPADRLYMIAEYLDIPAEKIMYPDRETKKKEYYTNETAEIAQAIFDSDELRLLFHAAADADPEDIQTAYQMLIALKRKETRND